MQCNEPYNQLAKQTDLPTFKREKLHCIPFVDVAKDFAYIIHCILAHNHVSKCLHGQVDSQGKRRFMLICICWS